MANPRAGVDYPRNWHELLAWFPDDPACLRYLERLRWSDGFVCRFCGVADRGWWQRADGLRRCKACRCDTSVTAGTIFAGTRTPLTSWFAAVWYVVNQKQGVSALGLQRVLGLGSYETAWAWLHKLRRAMVRPDPGCSRLPLRSMRRSSAASGLGVAGAARTARHWSRSLSRRAKAALAACGCSTSPTRARTC
jgi:hypothetical protein